MFVFWETAIKQMPALLKVSCLLFILFLVGLSFFHFDTNTNAHTHSLCLLSLSLSPRSVWQPLYSWEFNWRRREENSNELLNFLAEQNNGRDFSNMKLRNANSDTKLSTVWRAQWNKRAAQFQILFFLLIVVLVYFICYWWKRLPLLHHTISIGAFRFYLPNFFNIAFYLVRLSLFYHSPFIMLPVSTIHSRTKWKFFLKLVYSPAPHVFFIPSSTPHFYKCLIGNLLEKRFCVSCALFNRLSLLFI